MFKRVAAVLLSAFIAASSIAGGVVSIAGQSNRYHPDTQQSAALLTIDNFTYLGYYDFYLEGLDSPYVTGVAARVVSGNTQIYTWGHELSPGDQPPPLYRVDLAGRSYGDLITSPSASFTGMPNKQQNYNIWWDDGGSRLWTVQSPSYTTTVYPTDIEAFTIGSSTLTKVAQVSLEGINSKRVWSGAMSVPASYQSSMGIGPYVAGLGGYTSLVAAGGGASMGPAMFAMPDPSGYSIGAQIPASAFSVLANYGVNPVGSPLSVMTMYTDTVSYPHLDATGRPDVPPDMPLFSGADPYGLGYWTWGAKYSGGFWHDTKGVVLAGLFPAAGSEYGAPGYSWYAGSNIWADALQFEVHVYDPADLLRVKNGTLAPDALRPKNLFTLSPVFEDYRHNDLGDGLHTTATYDPVLKRFYILQYKGGGVYINRLHVYQVSP